MRGPWVPALDAPRQRPELAQAVENLMGRALPRAPVSHPQAICLPGYEVQA
jgi:hypothetical protein